ncbi:hypothetical protein SCOCK_30045 [Actinacidiphila cocklensis]|uniref:Uncharacterized protein n=1 Tax=Actinacidiphila cocklensis TaxID=887465 RepID=A0A9W4DWJ3_9ACTN|nr:hypothetical protein SCOCK_30045 [Actinacidiphila cocklensis]
MGPGAPAAVLRQADHPRLADLRRLRLGPHRPHPAAGPAGRGRRAHPGALHRGVRAADRHPLVLNPLTLTRTPGRHDEGPGHMDRGLRFAERTTRFELATLTLAR